MIRVPRRARDVGVSVGALAAFVVLLSMLRGGSDRVAVTLDVLMARLGRAGRRSDAAGRWVAELVAAGLVQVVRRPVSGPVTYRLVLVAGERWDEVPRQVVEQGLRRCLVSPAELRTCLFADQAAGRRGDTNDTPEAIGARSGQSARTVRRHIERLAAFGVWVVKRLRAGWVLLRADWSQIGTRPGGLTNPASQAAQGRSGAGRPTRPVRGQAPAGGRTERDASARQGPAFEARHRHPEQPVPGCSGAGSRGQESGVSSDKNAGSIRNVAPAKTPPANTSASDRRSVSFRNAHERDGLRPNQPTFFSSIPTDTAPSTNPGGTTDHLDTTENDARRPVGGSTRWKRPRARVETRQDVSAALRRLPGDWRHGLAKRWRPGLAAVIATGLDRGLGVTAAAAAVGLYADLDESAGRHVPAARAGLARLLTDVRLGLACPGCGEQLRPPTTAAPTDPDGAARCGCAGGAAALPLEMGAPASSPARTGRDPHHGDSHGQGEEGQGDGERLPVAVRAASWRALRADPAVVALSDPEAAAVLRGEPVTAGLAT